MRQWIDNLGARLAHEQEQHLFAGRLFTSQPMPTLEVSEPVGLLGCTR